MSLVGKRFRKVTEVEVIEELENGFIIQNVNDMSATWHIARRAFEANYVEVVNDDSEDLSPPENTTGTDEAGGDMAVSNTDETNTKEETK